MQSNQFYFLCKAQIVVHILYFRLHSTRVMILKRCILGELSLNIVYKSSYNHQFVSASSMNWKKNELTFVWHKKNLIKNLDIDRTLDISSKSFLCSIHCCSFSSFAVCKRLFTRSLMDFDDDQDRVNKAV